MKRKEEAHSFNQASLVFISSSKRENKVFKVPTIKLKSEAALLTLYNCSVFGTV
jgi:hypothetical protein